MERFCKEKHKNVHRRPITDGCEESISDEDNYEGLSGFYFTSELQSNKRQSSESQKSVWSAISEEANDLVSLHEKIREASSSSTISNAKRARKDGKGKGKHKFSIEIHAQRQCDSSIDVIEDENIELYTDANEIPKQCVPHRSSDNSISKLLDVIQQNDATKGDAQFVRNVEVPDKTVSHSMSMLLEELEDQNTQTQSKKCHNLVLPNRQGRDRKNEDTGKKMSSLFRDRFLDNEQNLDHLDTGISSDDQDQDIDKNLLPLTSKEIDGKMMVDLFQKAFSCVAVEPERCSLKHLKHSGVGYYGRLQQVLQEEKDSRAEFLRRFQKEGVTFDEPRCVDVQILSRSLDAKLTVCCCCLLDGNIKKTVIFKTNICEDVDVEVGNMIRLHPPWQEVQVSPEERVLLCRYFSRIMNLESISLEAHDLQKQ